MIGYSILINSFFCVIQDSKFVTLFLVLVITISVIVPVQSGYGMFQPQYFQLQSLQQPYNPYPYYDIYRVSKTDFFFIEIS